MRDNSLGLSSTEFSDDAKAVMSAYVSRGMELEFPTSDHMVPTATMQSALDELVGKNVLRREPLHHGGVRYCRLADCSAYLDWLRTNPHAGTWHATEPMADQAVAA